MKDSCAQKKTAVRLIDLYMFFLNGSSVSIFFPMNKKNPVPGTRHSHSHTHTHTPFLSVSHK